MTITCKEGALSDIYQSLLRHAPSLPSDHRFSLMNLSSTAAASSSSGPSTVISTRSPSFAASPMRLQIFLASPSFPLQRTRISEVNFDASFTSIPAGLAWIPSASRIVYSIHFIAFPFLIPFIFSLYSIFRKCCFIPDFRHFQVVVTNSGFL